MFYQIHIVGIVVAAIASMVVGTAWYSPYLFGKRWMALVGFPDMSNLSPERKAELKKKANQSMVIAFLASLVTAFVLERVIYHTPLVTLKLTLTLSILLWLGFVAAMGVTEYVYSPEPKPKVLYAITLSHQLASIVVMTLVLYFLT